MYESHFGLTERPFSIAPDPRYLFPSARHREALAHLLYGIGERGGFVVLTGEVGTGKTLITRTLTEQLPAEVDLALVLNPNLTVREFLRAIFDELKIELPGRSHSTQALVDELNRYLLDSYARGRHTVVLVDEAHCLSALVLEQVRLLTNLETTREKLLQIILVGQPELKELLERQDMRQVNQRITARYHLAPLSFAETRRYIDHRTRVAGAAQPLFSLPAQWLIHRRAGGIPRLLNLICDRALLGAYAHRQRRAGMRQALRAAREIRGERPPRWPLPAAVATGVLLAVTALAGTLTLRETPPTPPARAQQTPPPAGAPSLENWLAGGDTGLGSALGALFALWGSQRASDDVASACERAPDAGLRCYYESGDWDSLRRKNLPAVLELRDARGQTHRVLARRIRDDAVILLAGGREQRFPLEEVTRLWQGDYLVLWRPPAIGRDLITPGSRGVAVDWLVQRLDRVDGQGPSPLGQTYDRPLEQRVRAFQAAQQLEVDGVVGENTLIHLMAALPDGSPRLQE